MFDFITYIWGLFFGCPKEKVEKDCPMEKYRKGDKEKAFNDINNLSIEEKQKIVTHHSKCTNK